MDQTQLDKDKAFEQYNSLKTISEFNRLLNVGMFKGEDRESLRKCDEYLEKQWKNTIANIEANTWYQEEKAAMQSLDVAALMTDSEHDPNYKVTMADVFRKMKS